MLGKFDLGGSFLLEETPCYGSYLLVTLHCDQFQVVTDTLATMPQQMLEDGQTSLADGMIGMRRMVERWLKDKNIS